MGRESLSEIFTVCKSGITFSETDISGYGGKSAQKNPCTEQSVQGSQESQIFGGGIRI